MRCMFCGAENDGAAVYCATCGRRLDGKVECPACRGFTQPGSFCTLCGSPLDGRIKCPKCGEVYEGSFCPKCGTPANWQRRDYAPPRRKVTTDPVEEREIGFVLSEEDDFDK